MLLNNYLLGNRNFEDNKKIENERLYEALKKKIHRRMIMVAPFIKRRRLKQAAAKAKAAAEAAESAPVEVAVAEKKKASSPPKTPSTRKRWGRKSEPSDSSTKKDSK